MPSDNDRKAVIKKNISSQHERVIKMLPENNRDYILEELAVLMGCVPQGLGFETVKEEVKKPQPLFIVYPGQEEGAFAEAKKQLASPGQKVFDVQWMEIALRALHETNQQDIQNDPNNNNSKGIQNNNERQQPPYYAHFAKESAIKTLLTQERKCLLFLISIGRDYHQGERLAATIDLFRNVIKECAELAQQQSHAPNANSKSNRVKGPWRILIVKADTLQAYNEGNTAEAIEKYRQISKKWEEEVSVLFQYLKSAGDQIVPVELEFISWEPFLKRAKESYHFEAFYKELSEIYLYSSAHALTKSIDEKGWAFIERQELVRGVKKSIKAMPLPDLSRNLLGLSQGKQEEDEGFITKQRHLVKCYSYECNPELRPVGLHEINDNYAVERTEILAELKNVFSSKESSNDNNNGCPIVSLHGMSAAGKSHLACYYAHHASQYTYRIWMKADSKKNLQLEYKSFGQDQEIVDDKAKPEKILAEVKQWLENLGPGRKWLLILDDVNDYKMIKSYIPAKGGDVIITSQKNNWETEDNIHGIAIDVMTPAQALALLQNIGRRKTEQEKDALSKLAEKLGYLPLALEQAGAYLQKYLDTTIEAYIKEYDRNCAELMSEKWQLADGLASKTNRKAVVAATFHMSLERMNRESKEFAHLAKEMINACAYLASDNIPIELLANWLKQAYPKFVVRKLYMSHQILERLAEHSLIKYNKATGVISIHAVMQDILRCIPANVTSKSTLKTNTPAEQLQALATALIDTEDAMDIYSAEFWEHSKRLMPQLESFLSHYSESDNIGLYLLLKCILADLQNRLGFSTTYLEEFMPLIETTFKYNRLVIAIAKDVLGRAYIKLGNYQQAKALLEEALMIFKAVRHRKRYIAIVVTQLANVYHAMGAYQKAKVLLEEVLAYKKDKNRIRPVEIAVIQQNLATVYHSMREYQKAKGLLEEALAIMKTHYPKGHVQIAGTQLSLANVYRVMGDYQKAKDLLEEALAIKKAHYSERHVEIAITQQSLGDIYHSMGDYQKAKDLLEEALVIKKARYPKGHVEIAATQQNLATVYYSMRDYQKAKDLLEEALAIKKAHYSEGDMEIATAQNNLASAYLAIGNYQKAKGLLEEALALIKAHYPEGHVDIAITQDKLATVYTAMGDYQKAKGLLEEALGIKKAHNPEKYVLITGIQQNLAIVYRSMGEYQKAKGLLEEALAIVKAYYPKGHVEIATAQQNLATVYQAMGNYQKAKGLIEEALAIVKAYYPEGHLKIAVTKQNLATVYQSMGNYRKAKWLSKEALAIMKAHYTKESIQKTVLVAHLNLAISYLRLLKKVLAIKKDHYPEGDAEITGVQQDLAKFYQSVGNYQKAKGLLEEELAIKKDDYPEGDAEITGVQQDLAKFYQSVGDYQKAKGLLEEVLAIKKVHYPEDHAEIAGTQQNLARVYLSMGNYQKAKVSLEEALAIKKNYYPEGLVSIAVTQQDLANVYQAMREHQKARGLLEEALAIIKAHYPEVSVLILNKQNYSFFARRRKSPKFALAELQKQLNDAEQVSKATALYEEQERIQMYYAQQLNEAEADNREDQTHDSSANPEHENKRYVL